MTLDDRILREKKAHDEDDVLSESVKLKSRFHHILTYPSYKRMLEEIDNLYNNSKSLKVLDYGCGKGMDSLKLLKSGAKTYGIDISENYIQSSIKLAKKNNFNSDQFNFQVMDAHDLKFESNTFDLVIGKAILHHLDVDLALKSIYKVLKPKGRAIFIEPLADNPFLKIFRMLTPKARTVDEAPFSKKDLKKLVDKNLWNYEKTMYCGLVSAPVAVITSILLPNKPNNVLLKISDKLENSLNTYDYFKYLNQYILLNLQKI
ncbi:MAG: hypothetical protein CMB83_05645 [Flammeovirgaceae bacterium]|nr:hypothetical protein [Flammeovirgaceae bacterium]|tara:strand:+ start:1910 stop:2692 length:783 start_codon:yes stop_codon:yes gene_type:complete